ncbi:hypothetical protein Tco_0518274 [Tanacetum coccineum]
MSDSDESRVTYTGASSPFKDLSDIRSPRADDHEYLELPGMPEGPYVEAALQAPPSPDYVSGLKEPEQAPPSPDYVQGPEHADDEIVIKDQPYAEDASPTAQSPDYVPESDPEVNLEENDDEDPEEDPVDYPADGGDDRDDEDKPSKEDEDDDVDMEANEDEEEEEHPAPVDSVVVALPTTDQAPSAEETESFETDESVATPPPHPAHRVTARIYIPAPIPTPVIGLMQRLLDLSPISTPPHHHSPMVFTHFPSTISHHLTLDTSLHHYRDIRRVSGVERWLDMDNLTHGMRLLRTCRGGNYGDRGFTIVPTRLGAIVGMRSDLVTRPTRLFSSLRTTVQDQMSEIRELHVLMQTCDHTTGTGDLAYRDRCTALTGEQQDRCDGPAKHELPEEEW